MNIHYYGDCGFMIQPEPLNEYDRPKYYKRADRKRKRFGIEHYSQWFKRWNLRQWYSTKKQRDQALEMLIKHTPNIHKLRGGHLFRYRKVDRQ